MFLNLITNAVDAMPQGKPGVITLRTARQGKDMVRVEIQDNGSGIPKDVLAKIFDPFFTTKAVGKGTGMGLSISYKIIQEHGGRIHVNTELGVGTVFAIVLPISASKVRPCNDCGRGGSSPPSARRPAERRKAHDHDQPKPTCSSSTTRSASSICCA